jgi:hypothetical protein
MRRPDHAEDQVRLWASAAGFLVNSSQRDRAGWDHLLDLSEPREAHANENFLGIPSRSLSARVQVKSVVGSSRRVQIKLSNLQRAIEDPLPWIYLIIRYAKGSLDILEVAAVHLDKTLTERVLERIHSMPPDDLRRLHRKSFAVSWSEADILQPPSGRSLRSLIESAVPTDLLSYAVNKKNWADQAGLPVEPRAEVKFSVVGSTEDELFRQISRAAIGLEDALTIKGLEYTRERFGAMRPDPKLPTAEEAKLGMLRSDADGGWTLSVVDRAGSRRLEMPVFYRFSGAVIPGLPEKYWLSRIETPFLDIVGDHAANSVSLHFRLPQDNEPVRVTDLADSLSLMMALSDVSGESIRVCLSKAHYSFDLNFSAQTFEPTEEFKEFGLGTIELAALMRELQVPADTRLSIREIEQRIRMSRFVRGARYRSKIPIKLEWPAERLSLPTGPAAAIISASLPIGDMLYIELAVAKGELIERSAEDRRCLLLLSNDVSSLGSYKYLLSDRDKFPFKELVEAAEKDLAAQGINTVITHQL